jgi:hypothetical protein
MFLEWLGIGGMSNALAGGMLNNNFSHTQRGRGGGILKRFLKTSLKNSSWSFF